MTCPIKDQNGEIDDEALHDLTQIGGYIVEGGIKTYSEWKVAMKAKVGDVFNEGDYQTVWQNVRADARQRTGTGQTATRSDIFIEQMAKRLGSNRRAADFANALVGPNGDTSIINKIVDAKVPLTAAENKIVSDAVDKFLLKRKPGEKLTTGSMSFVQKAIDDARLEAQQAKTPAPKKGPIQGPPTASDAWQKHLSGPLSPAGAKQLRQQLGEGAFGRIAEGKATDADTEAATRAYEAIRKNKPTAQGAPRLNVAPGFVEDLAAFRKSLIPPKPAPEVVPKVKLSEIPPSEQALFGRRVQAGLKGNTDAFFEDLRDNHRDIANALDRGHALTSGQEDRLGKLYIKHAPEPLTPTEATGMIKSLNDAVKEARVGANATVKDDHLEQYNVQRDKELEPKEPPTDDVLFDRHMARQLGSADAAEHFRESLGDDLYTKLVTEGAKALTPQETDAVTHAFAESAKPRSASNPSELSRSLAPIAKEARAQIALHEAEAKTETFEKAKGWVREQLADVLPARKLPAVDNALDALADGNHTGLSHVFNQFAPRGFVKTGRLYTQGAMLSNPASLATAVYSHLISAGVENTAAKFIASKLSGGLHASADMQGLSNAIVRSVKQGAPEVWQVLKHGENALTLQGANKLHKPGAPLQPEFTVGQGGKVGNAVSAVGRFPGRMHGAAWHAIGVGMQELTKQDAAHYAAIDEMEKRGEQWSPEEIRARARELYDNPTEAVLNNAQKLREEQMFQNPNAAAEMVKKAGPLATPILPFATVASNITGRALEHTPVGAAVSAYGQVKKFADTNQLPLDNLGDLKAALKAMPAMDRAHLYKTAARGIIGTGIIAAGYGGQRAGIVNAPNPKQGEYGSVNAFGRKIEAGRALGPYAAPLFLGADAAQNQENDEGSLPSGPQIAGAFSENPFGNVSEVYQNFTDESKPGRGRPTGAMKAAASVVGAEIPSFLRTVAASTDPSHSLRNANTDEFAKYIWNSVKKAVPGARETLPTLPYPEPSTMLPVPRNVPDSNGNFGLNFLREWAAARAQR